MMSQIISPGFKTDAGDVHGSFLQFSDMHDGMACPGETKWLPRKKERTVKCNVCWKCQVRKHEVEGRRENSVRAGWVERKVGWMVMEKSGEHTYNLPSLLAGR